MAFVCMESDLYEWMKRCPECTGRGYNWNDDGEEIECEACTGSGERVIDAFHPTP